MRIVAAQILRHNRPRLPAEAWPVLIAQVLHTGDRILAAKLARQARQLCPRLSKLRSSPRLTFPCPIPKQLLAHLNSKVRAVLRALPSVCRSLQYDVMVECGSMVWRKTPFAESLLAPSALSMHKIASCHCGSLVNSVPRYQGHVITREWSTIPCAALLRAFGANSSFQCRTYPSWQRICEDFSFRVKRFLRCAGYNDESMDVAHRSVIEEAARLLIPWLVTLPAIMQQDRLLKARRQLWAHGLVVARMDRNPGRIVVMCRELWLQLQKSTFLENKRYAPADFPPDDDPDYASDARKSFLAAVPGAAEWAGCKPSGRNARPQSYWTVKQKSIIHSNSNVVAKLRPLIAHSTHPNRIALRRVARALSILVCEARVLVMERRPSHLPMWQLHSGSKEWLQRVAATAGWWGCDEYDVADCFLNTPRGRVLDDVRFWTAVTAEHTRRQACFAIAKDGKKGDHRSRPSSIHYWCITVEQLLLACEWELANNDTFEAQSGDGTIVVLQQQIGLPIGGHLSAAFVELVALRREYCCAWPSMMLHVPTARYRDNFFIVLPEEPSDAERQATAQALSDLLLMPVGFERGGRTARCLELRLDWIDASKVKSVLAYRTDNDRQGESGDVRTWPEWRDPRAAFVLHGLLVGLATKLVTYADVSIGGFPASLRQAMRFLRQRAYPIKLWLRPFALELLRLGVVYGVLPRALRNVLNPHTNTGL